MTDDNSVHPTGSEFDIISKYFRPLAQDAEGALGLLDDAALVSVPDGYELAITTDAVVAGVHFLDTLSPEDIAHKVVGVNLSDLAAMGASPQAVFLAAQFTPDTDEDWIAAFANGLRLALEPSGTKLMGGDTVSTPGPMAFTLTALGHVAKGQALTRAGANPGDQLFVTGTIGDGALGLAALQGELMGLNDKQSSYLARRYARPEPRWAFGAEMARLGLATAAVDISDGLAADVGHICEASHVSAVINADLVPLSDAAEVALSKNPTRRTSVFCGGDDYELAFTAPQSAGAELKRIGAAHDVQVSAIGSIQAQTVSNEGPVRILEANGSVLELPSGGYQHL